MQDITSEMESDLEDFGETDAADHVLIGCAQAAEHYEIARYGLLKSWAGKLGYDEAVTLLDETLQEEKATDQLLTQIAEGLDYSVAESDAAADEETDEAENSDVAKTKPKKAASKAE